MSTRGFVGVGTPDQFNARYNHFDSYPTGLGAEVWATVQRFLQADRHVHGFATLLLGYTDWRQVASGGRCEYCGKIRGLGSNGTKSAIGLTAGLGASTAAVAPEPPIRARETSIGPTW